MQRSARIFVVDDNEAVREAIGVLLREAGHDPLLLAGPARLAAAIDDEQPALVLLDMNFTRDTTSGEEGLAALGRLRALPSPPPVVLLTAWGTIEAAVAAMKLGASDYLTKPWDNTKLLASIETHLALRGPAPLRDSAFGSLLGRSLALGRLIDEASRVAPTQATVLITGESGTGKSHLARAIAGASKRKDRPFVEVDVGALPSTLFASELFGHVRGAFTDARESRAGRVAAAKGGTLFLDEIGTLGALEQVKLLRLLQEGTYDPVGSDRSERADVRIIAATNLNLLDEVRAGRFRQDLYFRLAVFPLRMPSLRERRDDIAMLAARFVQQANEAHQLSVAAVSTEAISALMQHDWPGNVRELAHSVERACILRGSGVLLPHDFDLAPASQRVTLAVKERDAVDEALRESGGNISRAAAALGISRQALYRRLER